MHSPATNTGMNRNSDRATVVASLSTTAAAAPTLSPAAAASSSTPYRVLATGIPLSMGPEEFYDCLWSYTTVTPGAVPLVHNALLLLLRRRQQPLDSDDPETEQQQHRSPPQQRQLSPSPLTSLPSSPCPPPPPPRRRRLWRSTGTAFVDFTSREVAEAVMALPSPLYCVGSNTSTIAPTVTSRQSSSPSSLADHSVSFSSSSSSSYSFAVRMEALGPVVAAPGTVAAAQRREHEAARLRGLAAYRAIAATAAGGGGGDVTEADGCGGGTREGKRPRWEVAVEMREQQHTHEEEDDEEEEEEVCLQSAELPAVFGRLWCAAPSAEAALFAAFTEYLHHRLLLLSPHRHPPHEHQQQQQQQQQQRQQLYSSDSFHHGHGGSPGTVSSQAIDNTTTTVTTTADPYDYDASPSAGGGLLLRSLHRLSDTAVAVRTDRHTALFLRREGQLQQGHHTQHHRRMHHGHPSQQKEAASGFSVRVTAAAPGAANADADRGGTTTTAVAYAVMHWRVIDSTSATNTTMTTTTTAAAATTGRFFFPAAPLPLEALLSSPQPLAPQASTARTVPPSPPSPPPPLLAKASAADVLAAMAAVMRRTGGQVGGFADAYGNLVFPCGPPTPPRPSPPWAPDCDVAPPPSPQP